MVPAAASAEPVRNLRRVVKRAIYFHPGNKENQFPSRR
jgi:hypothetical protein